MPVRARSILVGYDDSDAARRALDRAADLAGYGSLLTVVSVAENGASSSAALASAREYLLRRHVSATYVEQGGEPAEVLVSTAGRLGIDLVVVGRSRVRSPHGDALGTVSAHVVRRAPCDVLVVY